MSPAYEAGEVLRVLLDKAVEVFDSLIKQDFFNYLTS